MVGTALALGAVLAYVFGSFMARPLDGPPPPPRRSGLGKQVKPLRSPLVEANTMTSCAERRFIWSSRCRQERARVPHAGARPPLKNQLAVVKGMALQTARQSGTVDQFVEQFGQRIQGLAESQDLMVRQNWQGAWLRDLGARPFGAVWCRGSRAKCRVPSYFSMPMPCKTSALPCMSLPRTRPSTALIKPLRDASR